MIWLALNRVDLPKSFYGSPKKSTRRSQRAIILPDLCRILSRLLQIRNMYAAYQCVEVVGEYLVGASAHKLQTFDLSNGSQISSWACPEQLNKAALTSQSEPTNDEDGLQGSETPSIEVTGSDSNQPAKRRKLSDPSNEEPSSVGGAKKGEKPRSCKQKTITNTSLYPNIVALTSSNDGKHVIIVTGEDKTIRVLQHDDGHLKQLSERYALACWI